MNKTPPVNFDKIQMMTEGDTDFRAELIAAIYASLVELKKTYIEGVSMEDINMIQEVRHKLKPSMELFEINPLNEILSEGKEILEAKGFGYEFTAHFKKFLNAVQDTINFMEAKFKKIIESDQ
jgi:chemotaxis protein histidine kinase CheA